MSAIKKLTETKDFFFKRAIFFSPIKNQSYVTITSAQGIYGRSYN